MTFAVITTENDREKVIGTVWAPGEGEARDVVSGVYSGNDSIHVRPVEGRELPLHVPE